MRHRKPAAVVILGAVMAFSLTSYAAPDLLQELENAFIAVGDTIRPCVVNINVKSALPEGFSGNGEIPEDIFRFFNVPAPRDGVPRPAPRREASGSGFIYSKDGYIVTNNHVVEGVQSIEVRFWNGQTLDAKTVGRDPQTDIAVIKVEAGFDLPVAALGDSDTLRVGQFIGGRQPAGSKIHCHPGHHRTRAGRLGVGPSFSGPHPDRCRHQPRQQRRASVQHRWGGDRNQRGHHVWRRILGIRDSRQCREEDHSGLDLQR